MAWWIIVLVGASAFARFARGRSPGRDDLVPTLEAAEQAGVISASQREQIVALRTQLGPP